MKLKILVVSLVAVLLGVSITGAVIFAQNNGEEGENGDADSTSPFVERVAEILELDGQTVEDAFAQAAREMRQEKIDRKIDWMLENGWITEEKAEEMREHLANALDESAESGHPFFGRMGRKGHHGFRLSGGRGHHGYGEGHDADDGNGHDSDDGDAN